MKNLLIFILFINSLSYLKASEEIFDLPDERLKKHFGKDTLVVNAFKELSKTGEQNVNEAIKKSLNAIDSIPEKDIRKVVIIILANQFMKIADSLEYQSFVTPALNFYQKTLTLYEIAEEKTGISNTLNNIGSIYGKINDWKKALEYYQSSLKIDEELKDTIRMICSYNNIGTLYFKVKDYDQSLEFYNQAINLRQSKDNIFIYSSLIANIALIYEIQKDYQNALKYHHESINLFLSLNIKNIYLCTEYYNIGDIYNTLNNKIRAMSYFTKALLLAKELNDMQMLSLIHESLSELHQSNGDFKNAYEHHVLFKNFNDSIFNENNIKQITELELNYKYEKEKELATIEQQKVDAIKAEKDKFQKFVIVSLIVFILIIIVLAMIILRYFFKEKKSNTTLQLQNQMIEERNEELNQLNDEIASQRDLLYHQKKGLTESIEYARYIQNALLSSREAIEYFPIESMIYYKPRDIVSGDFYWFKQTENLLYFAAADCTGHGVPGAFMSVLGISLLNEITNNQNLVSPYQILNELRQKLKNSLNQDKPGSNSKDGIDISLSLLDFDNFTLQYSGAINPLIIIRNNNIIELQGDRFPVGIHSRDNESFSNKTIELQKNDSLYVFTDGFISQFGGPIGKKFNMNAFKLLLIELSEFSMEIQKQKLEETFVSWKNNHDQIDDVLVMGIRV